MNAANYDAEMQAMRNMVLDLQIKLSVALDTIGKIAAGGDDAKANLAVARNFQAEQRKQDGTMTVQQYKAGRVKMQKTIEILRRRLVAEERFSESLAKLALSPKQNPDDIKDVQAALKRRKQLKEEKR